MNKRMLAMAVGAMFFAAAGLTLSGCWPPDPKEDDLVPEYPMQEDFDVDDDAPAEEEGTEEPVLEEPAEEEVVTPEDNPAPMSSNAPPSEDAAAGVEVVTAADIANLRNSAAGKPLVVNLWATWCIPCREEMPDFAQYYEAYGDEEVVFLSLASDEPEAAAEYKKEQALPFPVYVIGRGVELEDVSEALGVEIDGVLPTTVFFNFNERAEVHEGKLSFEQLEAKTKALEKV